MRTFRSHSLSNKNYFLKRKVRLYFISRSPAEFLLWDHAGTVVTNCIPEGFPALPTGGRVSELRPRESRSPRLTNRRHGSEMMAARACVEADNLSTAEACELWNRITLGSTTTQHQKWDKLGVRTRDFFRSYRRGKKMDSMCPLRWRLS